MYHFEIFNVRVYFAGSSLGTSRRLQPYQVLASAGLVVEQQCELAGALTIASLPPRLLSTKRHGWQAAAGRASRDIVHGGPGQVIGQHYQQPGLLLVPRSLTAPRSTLYSTQLINLNILNFSSCSSRNIQEAAAFLFDLRNNAVNLTISLLPPIQAFIYFAQRLL